MTTKEFKVQYALGSLSIDDRIKLADNPNTPIEILTILSTDENWIVLWHTAYNRNTPIDVLKKLSTDEYSDEIRDVATWRLSKINGIMFKKEGK
jgi:hypothetical protein